MSITPQTNATLEEIAENILQADSVCICGHVSPDGDAIGSVLGLCCALDKAGKNVIPLLADDVAPLDHRFDFLPEVQRCVHAKSYKGTPDLFICVDVPNLDRLGYSASKVHARAKSTITVDHHAAPKRMSDLSYTDPDAASTTMIVWDLVKHLGVAPDKDIATCCLSGLMTDTGSFQYQNANESAFNAASEMVASGAEPNEISANFFQRKTLAAIELESTTIRNMELICDGKVALSFISLDDMKKANAVKSDCDTLINVLRSIDGVQIACILKEQKDSVRGSLRAKDDTDVAAIAQRFGGGGHRAAAGFTMHMTLGKAIEEIKGTLIALIGEERSV